MVIVSPRASPGPPTSGGRPRVYAYDPKLRTTRDPIGTASTDPTLDLIVRRHGLTER
ncbi:hypothetical protein ACWEQL_00375 [Kitasatospora sp. NPDC004240]